MKAMSSTTTALMADIYTADNYTADNDGEVAATTCRPVVGNENDDNGLLFSLVHAAQHQQV